MVADEMVELAARAMARTHWPDDGRYAVYMAAARAAITAALAARPVSVKALKWAEEWSGHDEDIPVWRGNNPLGVHVGIDFAGKYKLEKHSDAPANELIERKAAAQANYEARVLAALED